MALVQEPWQQRQGSKHVVGASAAPLGCVPRPWLSLYGLYLKPKSETPAPAAELELAPIQSMLPDELLLLILGHVGAHSPYSLGPAACVCRQWRGLSEHPRLWEAACAEAFQLQHPDRASRTKQAATLYRGSWRRMFLEQPHLRFDGVFVSRNSYIKTGVADMSRCRTVHMVLYYRYYRFFPDGTMLYRTSPQTLAKVAKGLRLQRDEQTTERAGDNVYAGRYLLKGSRVYVLIVYPNSRSTEIRSRLLLRSTHPGANNRLDIESIVSYDREDGYQSSMLPSDPDAAHEPAAAQEHKRGMTTCVFVPWEQVSSSVLNLPVSEMDIFIPG